jgi:large subunit ribosomal protein L32
LGIFYDEKATENDIFGVNAVLPAKKISKSKTHSRRAHHALRPVNYTVCPKCGQAKLPHAACEKCGYLNSKITLKVAEQAEKKG